MLPKEVLYDHDVMAASVASRRPLPPPPPPPPGHKAAPAGHQQQQPPPTMSSAEYFEAAARPADVAFAPADLLRLRRDSGGGATRVFEVLSRDGAPLAWAVSDLLSAAECDEVIQLAEGAGMEGSHISYRTAKRTRAYMNQVLPQLVLNLNLIPHIWPQPPLPAPSTAHANARLTLGCTNEL